VKLLFAFTILVSPAVTFAQRFGGPSCPNCLGLAGPGSWIFWIIVLAVLGFVAFKLFRRTSHKAENPLSILNKRYASGEISKEEYDRIRKDIQ
jgi:putative membrane protein